MAVSINLLPEIRMVKIRNAKRRKFITTLTILIGVITAAVVTGLIIVLGYYNNEYKSLQNKSKQLQAEVDKSKDLEQDSTNLQQHLSSFSKLNGNRIAASQVFANLVRTIPPQVIVKSFTINDKYVASITGSISNQNDSYKVLGTFTKALEDYNTTFLPPGIPENYDRKPIFTDVTITQSAKDAANGNVSFGLSFKVDESVAKVNLNTSTGATKQ